MTEEEVIATAEVQCALLGLPAEDAPRVAFALVAWEVAKEAFWFRHLREPELPPEFWSFTPEQSAKMIQEATGDYRKGSWATHMARNILQPVQIRRES